MDILYILGMFCENIKITILMHMNMCVEFFKLPGLHIT